MTIWDPAKLERVCQGRRPRVSTKKVGAWVDQFLKKRVYPRQRKLGQIAAAWVQLLPDTLQEHTCLEGLSRGQLKVLVDDAASLYELNLMKHELLDSLREMAPNAAPSEIKLVRGQWYRTNEEGVRIADYPMASPKRRPRTGK